MWSVQGGKRLNFNLCYKCPVSEDFVSCCGFVEVVCSVFALFSLSSCLWVVLILQF